MPNYDAGSLNRSKRATQQYRDLDLDFGRNSVTNDVNKLTDIEACLLYTSDAADE